VEDVVRSLAPLARRVIVTRPNNPGRALEPEALAQAVRAAGVGQVALREPVAAALDEALGSLSRPDDVMVVTGSLYLTGEARRHLSGREPL